MHHAEVKWRTSSYTGSETCVEVSDGGPSVVMIRDTKARNLGILAIKRETWSVFVRYAARVTRGQL